MTNQDRDKVNACIVNVGLFRSGTTTLAKAAENLGMKAYREFPYLSEGQLKDFLQNPRKAVLDWYANSGFSEIIRIAADHDIICDGWNALLPFLPHALLDDLRKEAKTSGVHLEFIASTRDITSTVESELQHWTVHDLESKAGLTAKEREGLEFSLYERAAKHQRGVQNLHSLGALKLLPLEDMGKMWSQTLASVSDISEDDWTRTLHDTGVQNANPPLPVEGILMTMRFGTGIEAKETILFVESLLDQIEKDSLCRYLVVLGIDVDEEGSEAAEELITRLNRRAGLQQQLQSVHPLTNPPRPQDQPFAACSVWNEMAIVGWQNGADWVILLGDDIDVGCSYHYRAFYRSFLDIAKRCQVPFGFGCPWWNDTTFSGFPSFPCVGKAHFEIFGGLIPQHRRSNFVNQDLDPYLHRLYVKFMASPCVPQAILSNGKGGNIDSSEARYERIPAIGWQEFVLEDIQPIRNYLPRGTKEAILLDVIVPSYRVRLDYLQSICYLKVPEYMQTIFIIIVDNPEALVRSAAVVTAENVGNVTLNRGERILEEYLSKSGNTVRVRCNKTNVGASASRNRGLDESAAEFVLNLDDDLKPNPRLLEQYGRKLQKIEDDVVGLIGLVRFPRRPTLPLRHAAVLMSYLTFMFEIADSSLYENPAWGVTANILFRRSSVRFDLAYAMTGGGEDVDYALRVAESYNGGKLLKVPEAYVVHPFWPGSVFTLASHFFNWAVGDSCLFERFPKYRYWSFPNIPETIILMFPILLWTGPWPLLKLVPAFLTADFMVDFLNRAEYKHRCLLLQVADESTNSDAPLERNPLFYLVAHILANMYVAVLECGRLWGHIKRKDLLQGMCRRFDWHCGQLEKAPQNFRKREAYKFGLIVCILLYEFGWKALCHFLPIREIEDTTCANPRIDMVFNVMGRK